MIKASEGLRSLLKTLFLSLSNLMTTFGLLMMIVFSYAIAGMSIFGNIEFSSDGAINEDANFKSFYMAMSTLIRCCTGESWNDIYHSCYEEEGWIATVYWISF
jgi:hypothetical protein